MFIAIFFLFGISNMKPIALLLAIFACGSTTAETGSGVAVRSQCMGCHNVERTMVGPAFKAISSRYASSVYNTDEEYARIERKLRVGGKLPSQVTANAPWSSASCPPARQSVSDGDIKVLSDWIRGLSPRF